MKTQKLNSEVLEKVSQWLSNEGKDELNKIVNTESETDIYIKSMSNIDPKKLKVPYSLL